MTIARPLHDPVDVLLPPAAAIEERVDQLYLWSISLVAALGGLLFGYDWVVIGGAKPFYEPYFHLVSPAQQGWAMSCALIGCVIGAAASGRLSDRLGRQRMLILAGVVFTASSLGTALAVHVAGFVMWRIAGGVAIGLASSLSPMYIAEIAPAQVRGKLVAVNQLTIVAGMVLAQGANWLIARPLRPNVTPAEILHSWNGQTGWRWMFGLTALPAVVFMVALFCVPESPRWLAGKGKKTQALRILVRIGGAAYGARVLNEIEQTLVVEDARIGWREFRVPAIRKPMLLGIGLAVLQQWCGINVIFNYAQEVFTSAGYSLSGVLFDIVITGLVMLVFTFIAICTVDRMGRRPLMLAGCTGLAALYTCLGYAYFVRAKGIAILLLVVAAIAVYAMTLAPVTWVLLSEIFPNRVRATAMSIATTSLWIACFVLTFTFPLLNGSLGPAKTFWIYAGICAAGALLVRTWVPETKGKTLEQIEALWQ